LVFCKNWVDMLPLGFMQFETNMIGSKLILQYNQKEITYSCSSRLVELSKLFSVQQ